MLGSIMLGIGIVAVLDAFGERNKTHVKNGRSFNPRLTFGSRGPGLKLTSRNKAVDGPCFRCNGTGEVHGYTCSKCGGSGRYHHVFRYD